MIPAHSRRAMMPTTLSVATSMTARKATARAAGRASPSRIEGSMTRSVTAPKTYAWPIVVSANSALPTAETAKIRGSSRTATPSTPKPRRITPRCGGTGTVTALLHGDVTGRPRTRHSLGPTLLAARGFPRRVSGCCVLPRAAPA